MPTTEDRPRATAEGRPGAKDRITAEVTRWPGVTAQVGKRGEWSFRAGAREIGHLHGDRVAHFGFPRAVGAGLRDAGRVGPHPVAPDNPGWGARRILTADDERDVVALLRLNYDRSAA
ncbi:MAG TPA: luciferase family protein [Capillimicrobium sp.]